jgi:hypothetical protein
MILPGNQGCLNGRPMVKITVRTRVYPADAVLPSADAAVRPRGRPSFARPRGCGSPRARVRTDVLGHAVRGHSFRGDKFF